MLTQEVKKPVRTGVPVQSAEQVNQVVGVPKVVTEVNEQGRLVSKLIFEETPIEKMNDGLKVDDFALEVLLMNGYEPHRIDNSVASFDDIDKLSQVAGSLPSDKQSIESVKPYVKQEK